LEHELEVAITNLEKFASQYESSQQELKQIQQDHQQLQSKLDQLENEKMVRSKELLWIINESRFSWIMFRNL
jgi:hypothetical protein